jgi:hypothetical protein
MFFRRLGFACTVNHRAEKGTIAIDARLQVIPTFRCRCDDPALRKLRDRYYRRHATVAVEPAAPRVAVLAPGSYGEFKYWDGTTCVDKRYMERHFK